MHTIGGIIELQNTLVELAARIKDIVPGYTHMQKAQPILLAHYFLAYFEMLERDIARLYNCLDRVDVMPLGSGALAGVAYNIDRNSWPTNSALPVSAATAWTPWPTAIILLSLKPPPASA